MFIRTLPDLPSSKSKNGASATTPASAQGASESTESSTAEGAMNKNPIMFLNELGMARGTPLQWTEMAAEGQLHSKVFSWKVIMGDYEACGSGNNKKNAKLVAAQNLLQALPPEVLVMPTRTKRKGSKRKKPGGKSSEDPNSSSIGPQLPKVAKNSLPSGGPCAFSHSGQQPDIGSL